MTTVWRVILIVLLLNVVAFGGSVTWLFKSGRLNWDRYNRVVEILKSTVEQEAMEKEKAQRLALEAEEIEKKQAWLERVRQGPVSIEHRLSQKQDSRKIARQQHEQLQQGRQALLANMEHRKQIIESLASKIQAHQDQLEESQQKETQRRESDGFKNALRMLEQVSPRQSKQLMVQMVNEGKSDRAVAYLAAMKPRKAAMILKQFTKEEELPVFAALIDGLRQQ